MLFLFEPPKVESVRIVPQTVGGDISFTVSVVPDVRLLAMGFLGSRFLEVFLRCVWLNGMLRSLERAALSGRDASVLSSGCDCSSKFF